MLLNRSFIAAGLCALAFSFTACGGSSNSGDDDGDDEPSAPEGTHYGYVVSKGYIPAARGQDTEFGLDLGATKTNKLDGTVDNALGGTFMSIAALANLDIQGAVTEAIDHGTILLLVDYQTADFAAAAASGLRVKIGDIATPAACADTTDLVCRHHLDGNGSFTVSANSPADAAVAGKVVSGTFNGGPGDLSLQIALGDGAPLQLALHGARAKATGMSATGGSIIVGGGLLVSDLDTTVFPAVHDILTGVIDEGCPLPRVGVPNCNCASTTTSTIINLFDGKTPAEPDNDCVVSLQEISNNPTLKSFLAPDLCTTASCTTPDALSLGIKVDVVKAVIQ